MLIATNYLSKKKYLLFKSKGVNIFLFNEIEFSTNDFISDIFFNCNSQKVPSTWYTWEENDLLLQSFKIKYPGFFEWNGYDMTLVFQKMLFWTNYKTGFLWYCKNKYYPDEEVCYIDHFHPYSIVKSVLRYVFSIFKSKKISRNHKAIFQTGKPFGIHLKDDFELGLYEHFIREISGTGKYRLFYDKNLSIEQIKKLGLKEEDITYIHTYKRVINFPSINLKNVTGKEWYILSSLLKHWEIINIWMDKAEQLADSGIETIIVNEAENGIYGACIGEVMGRSGIRVFNTMNGLKAGQAQDAFINFDKWFVWDEKMKKMLMDKCGLDDKKLLVSGHLMEDFADNYVYQNSLKIDSELLKDKKIISVFSKKSKRPSKQSVLNYLYNMVKQDESLFLIVRPHPLEKPEDYVLPDFVSDRIFWVNYFENDSKTTLYDQICLSDVCVVFGSTVALECKWFGKSCLSFEPRETSLLYFVDGYNTMHVSNIDSFISKLNILLERIKETNVIKPAKNVAERMETYLNEI